MCSMIVEHQHVIMSVGMPGCQKTAGCDSPVVGHCVVTGSTAWPTLQGSLQLSSAAFISCPCTPLSCFWLQVMTQPVVTPSGGSFNRPALMEWIRQHHTDPVSGAPLRSDQVFPNLAMRDMIHAWACGCAAQHGRSSKQRNEQQQQHIPKVQATGG